MENLVRHHDETRGVVRALFIRHTTRRRLPDWCIRLLIGQYRYVTYRYRTYYVPVHIIRTGRRGVRLATCDLSDFGTIQYRQQLAGGTT